MQLSTGCRRLAFLTASSRAAIVQVSGPDDKACLLRIVPIWRRPIMLLCLLLSKSDAMPWASSLCQ